MKNINQLLPLSSIENYLAHGLQFASKLVSVRSNIFCTIKLTSLCRFVANKFSRRNKTPINIIINGNTCIIDPVGRVALKSPIGTRLLWDAKEKNTT